MMKRETITIADIYVPTKRRGTLEQKRVDEIAASILDKGLQAPILVRADGRASYSLRVCTDWRPPRRSANRPLSPSLSMHGSTELLPARCFAVAQRGLPQPLPSFQRNHSVCASKSIKVSNACQPRQGLEAEMTQGSNRNAGRRAAGCSLRARKACARGAARIGYGRALQELLQQAAPHFARVLSWRGNSVPGSFSYLFSPMTVLFCWPR